MASRSAPLRRSRVIRQHVEPDARSGARRVVAKIRVCRDRCAVRQCREQRVRDGIVARRQARDGEALQLVTPQLLQQLCTVAPARSARRFGDGSDGTSTRISLDLRESARAEAVLKQCSSSAAIES